MNDADNSHSAPARFVGDFADALGRLSLPRMAGRILGVLLLNSPTPQTMRDLRQSLGASAGSISNSLQLLRQLRLARRVGIPGSRSRGHALTTEYSDVLLNMWISQIEADTGRLLADLAEMRTTGSELPAILQESASHLATVRRQLRALGQNERRRC